MSGRRFPNGPLVPLVAGALLVATVCSGYVMLAIGIQGRWAAAFGTLMVGMGGLVLAVFLVVRSGGR